VTTLKSFYTSVRNKVERQFENLGRFIYRARIAVLVIVCLLTGVLCYQIPKISMDTSAEGMLYKNDPIRLAYNAFRDQFGNDEAVIIVIKPPEVFNETFLTKLKAFHNDLEKEIPYIRKVSSLFNVTDIRGEDDRLVIEDLLSKWPQKSIDLNLLKERVMNNPILINNFISEDGRYTSVIVETKATFTPKTDIEIEAGSDWTVSMDENADSNSYGKSRYLSEKENSEIIKALNQVVKRYQNTDFPISVTGSTVVEDAFNRATLKDAALLMVIAPLPVLLFPLFLFRRFSGMIIPYLIIIPSLISTMGLMAIFNSPFTLLTGGLPPFIVAIGTGDSIHLLSIFYRRLGQGNSKQDAISYALGHSGPAIVMTTLTTAIGLLSFSISELTVIANFGIFAAVGVILALFYSIFMLPALLAIFPIKQKTIDTNRSSLMDRTLLAFADFSTTHPLKILAVSIVIFFVSIVALSGLKFSHFPLAWFPDDTPVVKDTILIDRELKGTIPLEIVIDTKRVNGIYEPDILNSIEEFSRQVENIDIPEISVGKIFSINDILKELHQALHGNDPAYYKIPQDRKTIVQELFLFENSGSDDLERMVDSEFRKTRITIRTTWVDAVVFDRFIKDIEKKLNIIFAGKADISLTGSMSLIANTFPATLNTMTKSYVITFIVISVLMIFLFGGFKLGLVSMAPNLLPIIFVMGIIVACGFSLDMNTIMIGCIAIGVVVDDTVHFIYNFRKYYDKTGDSKQAVRETFLGTGRAMLITTLILASCFATNIICMMENLVRFGSFNALVIIFALLSDFLLAPALMVLVMQGREVNAEPELFFQRREPTTRKHGLGV
jgi:predicted RND superfamily exporter protein